MISECAAVVGHTGEVLLWHRPLTATASYLPDSQDLWSFLWAHRDVVAGIAHTHPWEGPAWPSATDLSTFDAVELGLGRELSWWVVTLSEVVIVRRFLPLRGWDVVVVEPPSWTSSLRALSVEVPGADAR